MNKRLLALLLGLGGIFFNSVVVYAVTHEEADAALICELIQNFLSSYHRPITIVDLEPSTIKISLAAATASDSTCVIIDGDEDGEMLNACELQKESDNLVLLKTKISYEDLEKLTECEYFDLAMVHGNNNRFLKNWKRYLPLLINLADNLVLRVSKGPSNKEFQHLQAMLC